MRIHSKRRQGSLSALGVFALLCLLLRFCQVVWLNIQPSRRVKQTDKNRTENKEKLG